MERNVCKNCFHDIVKVRTEDGDIWKHIDIEDRIRYDCICSCSNPYPQKLVMPMKPMPVELLQVACGDNACQEVNKAYSNEEVAEIYGKTHRRPKGNNVLIIEPRSDYATFNPPEKLELCPSCNCMKNHIKNGKCARCREKNTNYQEKLGDRLPKRKNRKS